MPAPAARPPPAAAEDAAGDAGTEDGEDGEGGRGKKRGKGRGRRAFGNRFRL